MQKKLHKCFIWDGRKCRDLCKKNYTNVLYGTDGNVETYAKKFHKWFIWDGRKCIVLCKKNYTNVSYGTDGNETDGRTDGWTDGNAYAPHFRDTS